MEKKLKLSHTQYETYKTCPRKYYNRYILNIKESTVGSPLVFGVAIDLGLNRLLQGASLEDAEKAFLEAFTYQVINFKKEYLPESDKIVYFKKDLNPLLIKENEQETPWNSLKNLGLMMLQAYKEQVMPRIQKVHFIQKEILLESDTTDIIGGIADFGATIDGFNKVIVDNKTSSRKYAKDSVKLSPQLALYQYALNADKAAYVVLLKDPIKTSTKVCEVCGEAFTNSRIKTCNGTLKDTKKRCNGTLKDSIKLSIDVQIIIDDVCKETTEKMLEEFSNLSYNIKTGNFDPDWDACNNQYGRKCPYFEYCRNGSLEGLVKKE